MRRSRAGLPRFDQKFEADPADSFPERGHDQNTGGHRRRLAGGRLQTTQRDQERGGRRWRMRRLAASLAQHGQGDSQDRCRHSRAGQLTRRHDTRRVLQAECINGCETRRQANRVADHRGSKARGWLLRRLRLQKRRGAEAREQPGLFHRQTEQTGRSHETCHGEWCPKGIGDGDCPRWWCFWSDRHDHTSFGSVVWLAGWSSLINARPDSGSTTLWRCRGDSIRINSKVGRTWASSRCPPRVDPSIWPTTM